MVGSSAGAAGEALRRPPRRLGANPGAVAAARIDTANEDFPMRRRLLACSALGFGVLAFAAAATAETLSEALVDAYNNNPQILSERATLRATDEGVPQALSGWRPTVTATGSAGFQHSNTSSSNPAVIAFPFGTPPGTTGHASNATHPTVLDLNITQPVYQGGRTVA